MNLTNIETKLEMMIRDELNTRYPRMTNAEVNLQVIDKIDTLARRLVKDLFNEEKEEG